MLNALRDWLASLFTSAWGAVDELLTDTAAVLTDGLGNWDEVLKLSEYLKPFCYTIIAICLLVETVQVMSRLDGVKWEHGLRIGVKAVLAKIFIDIAPVFLKACYTQSIAWVEALGNDVPRLDPKILSFGVDAIQTAEGLGNILGMFLSLFVVILGIKICSLVVQLIAFGRIFEIYVYLVISPVPCAFMPLGSGDGGGISPITSKFLKNFIAVCLQGVMIMVVINVFNAVMSGALGNLSYEIESAEKMMEELIEMWEGGVDIFYDDEARELLTQLQTITSSTNITELMYTMLLSTVALVMSVVKSGSWAKSVIDAM